MSRYRYAWPALGLALPFATMAGAQLLDHKDLSLATALTIATTAADTGKSKAISSRSPSSAATVR